MARLPCLPTRSRRRRARRGPLPGVRRRAAAACAAHHRRHPPTEAGDADELRPHDQTVELPAGRAAGRVDRHRDQRSTEPPSSSATISDPPPPLVRQAAEPPGQAGDGHVRPRADDRVRRQRARTSTSRCSPRSGKAASRKAAATLGATIKQKETITGIVRQQLVADRQVAARARPAAQPAPAGHVAGRRARLRAAERHRRRRHGRRLRRPAVVDRPHRRAQDAQERRRRDAAQRDKFISEAVVTGELDHPNIVPIYDLGANDEGALFYSMKRVKGTPWNKVIKEKSLDENLQHPAARRRRGGVRPRQRRDSPRPEARERHARRLRRSAGDGLGPGAGHARVPQRGVASASPTRWAARRPTWRRRWPPGPLEKITPASDVYLLGAILYEIITGKPPHTGKTVMACLFAAAKNQIAPTDKTGELVDIALKAMATAPEERHASVQEFQAAVREYQAHAESIELLGIAAKNLDEGGRGAGLRAVRPRAVRLWRSRWRCGPAIARADDAAGDGAARLRPAGARPRATSTSAPRCSTRRTRTTARCSPSSTAGRRERESRQRRIKLLKGAVAALVGVGHRHRRRSPTSRSAEQRDVAVVRARSRRRPSEATRQGRKRPQRRRGRSTRRARRRTRSGSEADEQRSSAEDNAARRGHAAQLAEDEKAEADRQRELAVEAPKTPRSTRPTSPASG